jgi:hypothetical protein
MKIRPVGAELFHADRRTDMTKLIVVVHNFVNAPKNINAIWAECNIVNVKAVALSSKQ